MKKLVVLMTVFMAVSLFADTDVDKVIKKIQDKYNKVETIHVDFKQVNRFQLTGITNEVYGSLFLTKDGKFRLETEDQTVVSNGEVFWRYNKLENQVLVDHAKKSQQDVFMNDFLFNISDKYFAQIISENNTGGKKIFEIKLTPKVPEESFFESIKVSVEEKSLKFHDIKYVDYNGNETEYKIEKFEIDPEVTPEKYSFEPPQGVEVVDLRL